MMMIPAIVMGLCALYLANRFVRAAEKIADSLDRQANSPAAL